MTSKHPQSPILTYVIALGLCCLILWQAFEHYKLTEQKHWPLRSKLLNQQKLYESFSLERFDQISYGFISCKTDRILNSEKFFKLQLAIAPHLLVFGKCTQKTFILKPEACRKNLPCSCEDKVDKYQKGDISLYTCKGQE